MREVAGVGFEPRSGLLLASDGHGLLAFIDPQSGTIVRRVHAGMLFDAELQRRRTADGDGRRHYTVRLWTLRAGLPAGTPRLYYPTGDAADVSLSPDGRTFAVASA